MKTTQRYAIFSTGMGWVGIFSSAAGLVATTLPQPSAAEAERRLGVNPKTAIASEDFSDLEQRLENYFSGQCVDFPDRLDLSWATDFQRRVWRVTQSIPYGETRSYGWVAKELGHRGARAVGQALARNRLPVIIPCHRVVGAGGLGGFSGGVGAKEWLLRLEASRPPEP